MPIPVLVGTGDVLTKNSITFNGLNINNAADDEQETYIIEDVSESDAWQQTIEAYPDRDGSQGLEPFAMSKIFRVRGWVRAPTMRKLYDKIETINKAFHPVLTYAGDTGYNRGFLPITFNVPTNDTANYATGLIPCAYYVQALRLPVSQQTKFLGKSARIDFTLQAADPRRYFTTTQLANRTGNGTIVCANTLASYPSYPLIAITTVTAPSGTPTIARTTPSGGTISFVGSQLLGATDYLLDLQARTFYRVSGPNLIDTISAISGGSVFSSMAQATSNTWTIAGWPADAYIEVGWLRAFI